MQLTDINQRISSYVLFFSIDLSILIHVCVRCARMCAESDLYLVVLYKYVSV